MAGRGPTGEARDRVTMAGMPLPATDTVVTFPSGSLTERSTVRWVEARDDRLLVLTDRTPFHPEDPNWPDQGSDDGTLTDGSRTVAADCRLGATDGSVLHVGVDIPVRRGAPGWAFVVVHSIDRGTLDPADGDEVTLTVDADRRGALSAGHTGCHLAALALNAALAGRWRKPAGQDSLGHPDFDRAAITSSRVEPFGSVDEYRIGRSLRRSGFHPPAWLTSCRRWRTRSTGPWPVGSRPAARCGSTRTGRA